MCPSATDLITHMAASRVRVVGEIVSIMRFDGCVCVCVRGASCLTMLSVAKVI